MSGDTTSLQAMMLPRTAAPFEATQEPQVKQSRGRLEQAAGPENMGHGCWRQWAGLCNLWRQTRLGWVRCVAGFLGDTKMTKPKYERWTYVSEFELFLF